MVVDKLKSIRTKFADKFRHELKSKHFRDTGTSYNQILLYQFFKPSYGFSSMELNINKKCLVLNVTFSEKHRELVQSLKEREAELFPQIDGEVKFTTTGQGHFRLKVKKPWNIDDKSRWSATVKWVCSNGDQVIEILCPIIKEYATKKGIPMAGCNFVNQDSYSDNIFDEIEKVRFELAGLTKTEQKAIIDSRIGQGKFRESLIKFWRKCLITGIENPKLLRASHIKPWKDSTNEERLDPNNGLLLTPVYDHLFDKGFISFSDTGQLLVSEELTQDEIKKLGINIHAQITALSERSKHYLKYHREHIFKDKHIH